ncbi:MAG: DUF4112 domain-containing protein [Cyanobacteria bacterium P01_A01_bin.114]
MPQPQLSTRQTATLARLRQISRLLDNAVPIPGVGYRVGLDPLIGLIPGGGDLITGIISVYIVIEAARFGVPATTLGRMGFNILMDVLSGTIPVVGDFFDIAWKANAQNMALLERYVMDPVPSGIADRIFAVVLIAVLLAIVVAVAGFSVWIVSWFLRIAGR